MVSTTKIALNEAGESIITRSRFVIRSGLYNLKKTARFMFQKVKYLFLPYERTKLCGSF